MNVRKIAMISSNQGDSEDWNINYCPAVLISGPAEEVSKVAIDPKLYRNYIIQVDGNEKEPYEYVVNELRKQFPLCEFELFNEIHGIEIEYVWED